MRETKYTPGPWYNNGQTVYGADGDEICTVGDCTDDRHKANAVRIVRCVNAHDDLLEACESLQSLAHTLRCSLEGYGEATRVMRLQTPQSIGELEERARAAIAKAEAVQP